MPIFARSACISSAIVLAFGLYGRCTGMYQRSVDRLVTPASASMALAFSGSYG